MDFKDSKNLFQNHVYSMINEDQALFSVDLDKDELWETYLNSFPEGSNPIFRERRAFDCSFCRHFIKSFGGVVTIDSTNNTKTIWDFETNDHVYQPVVEVRLQERKSAQEKANKAEKKQKLLSIISEKQDQELRSMSVDDLIKLVDEI